MSILSPKRLKARLAPHLSWQVPMKSGVYQNSRFSNPDLDPVKPEDRTWGALVHLLEADLLIYKY